MLCGPACRTADHPNNSGSGGSGGSVVGGGSTGSLSGGGGAGKATISDLNIVKNVDASSTELLKACMTGKHLDQAKLFIRKAGEKPLEYMVITLTKVLVTGVQTSGAQASDRLQETVGLNFAQMKVDYDTQSDKGGKGSHYSMGYDVSKNTVV